MTTPTCRMIDPGPDNASLTCLTCGRPIVKTVRPSGVTWWDHDGPSIGSRLVALNAARKVKASR